MKPCPHGDTWAKRALGKAYDPDKHCPYTGLGIWPWPAGDRMLYWREDGHLSKARALSSAELEWIRDNAEEYASDEIKFKLWLTAIRKENTPVSQ